LRLWRCRRLRTLVLDRPGGRSTVRVLWCSSPVEHRFRFRFNTGG